MYVKGLRSTSSSEKYVKGLRAALSTENVCERIKPERVQEVLGYIYCGRLDTGDMEVLKGVYLAANMLQMADLGKPN
jgi:hypothetical protein